MAEFLITLLLSFSCFYLVATSLILIRNRFDLTPLPEGSPDSQAFISILIPARNEEGHIEQCVRSACRQNYDNFEVIVLDDESDDRTPEILGGLQNEFKGILRVINGREKPSGWLGKPWACKQLGDASAGEILVFIDADVTIKAATLAGVATAFDEYRLDMLTVWPRQVLKTFWEQTLIPLVYYTLTTLLPAIYVYRQPRWMPRLAAHKTRKLFAAACGQFLAFRKDPYERIGTHEFVKNNIVEDVGLAKAALENRLTLRMFEGGDLISCRMYTSEREIRNGFRKNFFAGFGYSYPLFILAAAVHLIVFIAPFILLPASLPAGQPVWLFLSTAAVAMILLHRLILSVWFRWNPLYSMLHPLGVLWFQMLAAATMVDKLTGKKNIWKQRAV